jgi:hypothetical protein
MSTSCAPKTGTAQAGSDGHGATKITASRKTRKVLSSVALAVARTLAGVPKGREMVDPTTQNKPENANGPYGSFWLSKCKSTSTLDVYVIIMCLFESSY